MLRNEHKETLAQMIQELTLIETKAKQISHHFQKLIREVESLKMESLQKLLEEKIKSKAHGRGIVSVRRDQRLLTSSILLTAGASIFEGLLTRDGWGALNFGLSSLNGALRSFGRAEWTVLLGRRIIVAASDGTPIQKPWLAWGSLKTALVEVQKEALAGEALGNLDDVLQRLEQRQGRIFIPVKQVTGQPESQ